MFSKADFSIKKKMFPIQFIAICLYLCIKCAYAQTQPSQTGLFPPVFTPMDKYGAINVSVVPAYAKFLKSQGVSGLVVADLSGEGRSLGLSEKKKLLNAWVTAAKPLGLYVSIQVGGIPSPDVFELASYAETMRVNSILALPPSCYKGNTVKDLVSYIEQLSKAAKSLPIYYYDYPSVTGVSVDMPTFFKRASNKIPQFKGIKVQLDVAMAITAVCKVRPDQTIIIFHYLSVAPAALMGFDTYSTTESSFLPRLTKDIITYTEAGEVLKARRAQERLNRIAGGIKEQGDHVSALKIATEIVTGLELGNTRFPLEPITKRGFKKIADILKDENISIAPKL